MMSLCKNFMIMYDVGLKGRMEEDYAKSKVYLFVNG